MRKIRIAVYIRVSTAEQAKEGYSIGEQTERLKKFCEAMDWSIYKIYTDAGYSGGNTDRPGLREMIKDVESGEIDKVLVYKLDRLSRSQLDTLYLIEKVFLANDTDFVSMNENFDTSTPFGRAMIGILAVFAQLEREQIKERMMMGKEARAKEGKWTGGKNVHIGYDYDLTQGKLVINEYEAMQYRELIDLFLKGTPIRSIERIFDLKGYEHKNGKWSTKTIRDILLSKVPAGYVKWHDEYYKGEHEPIIDEETLNKAIKMMNDRKDAFQLSGHRNGHISTYLGGLLYCKHCGGRYTKYRGGRTRKDGSTLYYYSCYSRNKKLKTMIKDPNCKNKNWRMEELEDLVIGEIKKLALNNQYLHDLKQEKQNRKSEPNKIEILEKEIEKIDEQISRFMDLYGIGKFTIEQVQAKIDPLNNQRRQLSQELDNLNAESGRLSEEDAREIVANFDRVFKYGDFDAIRAIIESLIYYIELDNDDVYIHWKFC